MMVTEVRPSPPEPSKRMEQTPAANAGRFAYSRDTKKLFVMGAVMTAIIVLVTIVAATRDRASAPLCVAPYLSGAANYELGRGWRVNKSAVADLEAVPVENRMAYRAPQVGEERLEPFVVVLDQGYLFITLVARTIFWWSGDLQALVYLQGLAHIAMSWLVLWMLKETRPRLLFIVFYAINPIVLHIVTVPYYYCWQAVGSTVFVMLLLARRPPGPIIMTAVTGVLLALFWTRGSTVLLALASFALILVRHRSWWRALFPALFLAGIALGPRQTKPPEHTMYVGFGAYPNPEGIELADASGYRYYEKVTGERESHVPGGNFYTREYWGRYRETLRAELVRLVKRHPVRFVAHAIVNTLQGFSIGYLTQKGVVINIAIAISGLAVAVVLGITKQRWLLAANLASLATFTPYYPPTPAYMFSSYLLLGLGAALAVDHLMDRGSRKTCEGTIAPTSQDSSAESAPATACAHGLHPAQGNAVVSMGVQSKA